MSKECEIGSVALITQILHSFAIERWCFRVEWEHIISQQPLLIIVMEKTFANKHPDMAYSGSEIKPQF